MLRFTLNRLAQAVAVILVVFTITFFLIRLAPGDPFAGEKAMPPDVRRVMEERYVPAANQVREPGETSAGSMLVIPAGEN